MAYEEPTQLAREVRDALEEAMRLEGLSIRGLAVRADCPASTVSRILNFERIPSVDMVDRLFRAMNLEPTFRFD